VTVVLPTYNGARYIAQALDAILSQTYRDLEVIVVDGGSTDGTLDLVASYHDARIRILHQDGNVGRLPGALNLGFADAKGTYLTWTQDDDCFSPCAIQTLAEYLDQNPEVDFAYCDYGLADEAGHPIRCIAVQPPEFLRESNCVGHCFLFRRKVYERVGEQNTADAYLVHDYEYWVRVSLDFTMRVCPVSEPLYFHRMHSANLSSKHYFDVAIDLDRVRAQFFGVPLTPVRQIVARRYIERGFEAYARRDLAGVRLNIPRGILRAPSYLRNRGVISIFAESIIGEEPARLIRRFLRSRRSSDYLGHAR
jgi:glycosyltransferase involved in cell wall biosynthesis